MKTSKFDSFLDSGCMKTTLINLFEPTTIRLDKVMIKYNEAQSIRSTYAHIVKRLKEERLSFNNQMTALERTLKAKNRDHDELLLLSNDANHAKEMAQQELQNARHTYEEKRTRRAGEMRERQQVVRIRKQMLDKQEKRDAKKKELLGQQMDRSRRESENDLGLHPYSVVDDKEREEDQDQKLNIYEETFRKIKDAMGVGDVNNVLDKIYNQKSSAANLQMLTKQNRMHLDHLKREKDALTKKTEELKFNEDIVSISRKTIEDKEEVLVERYVVNIINLSDFQYRKTLLNLDLCSLYIIQHLQFR